jgi:hypothetical protein
MSIRYQNGEIVFHYEEDDDEVASALKNIFMNTEVGRDYKANYNTNATGAADYVKILNAAVAIAGGSFISEKHLQHALTLLIDSGELRPKKVTPAAQLADPESDTRPRGRDGRILTESQIAWGEMSRFAETASMVDINRRKASDPAFANFVRKSLEREMSQQIGDAVTPAGEPTTKTRANQELSEFAHKYNQEPSENLKPRGGFVLLAGEKIPYNLFLEQVNKATAARLL